MILQWIASFLAILNFVLCEAELQERDTIADKATLDAPFSLPDLINSDSIPSDWKTGGKAVLEQGRLRLTPAASSMGSIWNKKEFQVKDAFTVEWTFRSVDFLGKSQGGMSFWLVNGKSTSDTSLFGGPAKYDGIQVLIDSNGPLGSSVRGILSDGAQSFTEENIYDHAFGSCLLAYQDTTIPTTIRLSYDRSNNNMLKVQVDNRVCFQTRQIQIPQKTKIVFGITAKNDANKESFELLKVHTHNGITNEVRIPNTNPMEQPKLVTKIVDKKSGKEEIVESDFMKMKGLANKVDNYEIYKKLDKIEGKVLANDISVLTEKLMGVIETQAKHQRILEHLSTSFDVIVSSLGKESEVNSESFKDIFAMNDKLEQLLQDQEKIRQETKKNLENGGSSVSVDEIVKRLLIWILPLIFLVMIMAYYTFRIRQDIVKVKLL